MYSWYQPLLITVVYTWLIGSTMTRLLRQSHMTGQFSVRRSTFGSSEHALYHVVVCKLKTNFEF